VLGVLIVVAGACCSRHDAVPSMQPGSDSAQGVPSSERLFTSPRDGLVRRAVRQV